MSTASPSFDYATPLSPKEMMGVVSGAERKANLVISDNGNGEEVEFYLTWIDESGCARVVMDRIECWRHSANIEDELAKSIRRLFRLAHRMNIRSQKKA